MLATTARNLVVAATAFAAAAAAAGLWHTASEQAEAEARTRFDVRVLDISDAMRGRMLDYEQVLRGAAGLFAASESVERSEWSAYVGALEIHQSYPGIRGIGFAPWLPTVQDASRFEAGLASDGFSGARILPPGKRDGYVPVGYFEPLDERSRSVIGFDMYSESTRRAALVRARDTNRAVVTGPITLASDQGNRSQAGFLMFLPIYRNGVAVETLVQRRAALAGFVYGPFRAADLVAATVGKTPGIGFRLSDVTDAVRPLALYDGGADEEARFSRSELLSVPGRRWRIDAYSLSTFESGVRDGRPRLVVAGSIAIGTLLTMLVWSLLNTQARATALARRMNAAHEELDRFRVAIDRHWDTMIMVDADRMRIDYVNEGACRNLGYSRDELVGKSPAIVFADRDVGRLSEEYRELARNGEGTTVERGNFRRKDGSVLPVEISREILKQGDTVFVLGIARDISARLEAEQALRRSEGRLSLALESSGLALFDWDVRSGLVHLGKEWKAILGGAPEPSVTPIQKLQQLVHPDDAPALRERVRALLTGQVSSYRVEHRVMGLDGQYRWIESVAKVSERDAQGHASRVTGTNADVGERKEVGEMKNAFIANVSHELRTPLTGILASLELIREGATGELPPEARRFVEMAHGNGERLAKLIDDILDLERVESGRMRLALGEVDVAEILAKASSLNAPYAERYQARIKVALAGTPKVIADPDRLLQVLTNLVSNAAKYSPPGGEIGLSARAKGGRVEFSVADQGPGVPEEFRARLFGKFEQAERGKGGTGLGLAISKAMIERMGGHIHCDSVPGRGARFYFDLPAAG